MNLFRAKGDEAMTNSYVDGVFAGLKASDAKNKRITRLRSGLEKIAFCEQDCTDKQAIWFMREIARLTLSTDEGEEFLRRTEPKR